jgi:hypothetical protein
MAPPVDADIDFLDIEYKDPTTIHTTHPTPVTSWPQFHSTIDKQTAHQTASPSFAYQQLMNVNCERIRRPTADDNTRIWPSTESTPQSSVVLPLCLM